MQSDWRAIFGPALTTAVALPARIREELEVFFLTAVALEGKDARILGWNEPAAALELIRSSAS